MPTMWDKLKTVPHKQVSPLDDDDRIHVGLAFGAHGVPRGGYSYSIKGGPPPSRPPREFLESHHDHAPAVQEPPPRNPKRISLRASNLRPPSSVYSQPSPGPDSNHSAKLATRHAYRYGAGDEISPPSSPEPDSGGADRFLPGDVSPIDEEDLPDAPYQPPRPYHDAGNSHESRYGRAAPHQAARQSPPRTDAQGRGSSIPMMRRERRKQSDALLREANNGQRGAPHHPARDTTAHEPPRWDPLTGERTTSSRGRPSQVNPAEFVHGLGIAPQTWSAPQNDHGPAAAPQSFGDRFRTIAKKAVVAARDNDADPADGAFTSSRPGWRGASGRTTIVDPVQDNPKVAPLRIPEKSSRRNMTPTLVTGQKTGPALGGVTRRGQTPPMSPPPPETGTRPGPRDAARGVGPLSQHPPPIVSMHQQPQIGQSYPSPPLSGTPMGADAPSVAARDLARDGLGNMVALPSPTYNTLSPETASAIRRKPPPVHTNYTYSPQQGHYTHHPQQESISSFYSQPSPQPLLIPVSQNIEPEPQPVHLPHHQFAPPAVAPSEPWVQPPSRFSVTTYATSNTGTTRDDFDELDQDQPPVPAVPAELLDQARLAQADLLTGHSVSNSPVTSPIDQFMTSPFADAPPTTFTNPAIARAQAIERPASRASDVNKMLPPAPPEASAGEAQDRVAMLNAQLKALANRRININRSIDQMTVLMPTDNLMNSDEVVRKREAEKRKVEALRQELSEVQREEYELGLKLHRAYKRMDREAECEPTTLWVRRVTG